MKVSRKVARRSRKHTSSISRRRFRNNKNKKSGYKKRYAKTQKGGKYGKRGRGQKRVRTHKRGKRFHRGGFPCTFNQNKDGNLELVIQGQELFFKKNGILFQGDPSQKFDVTIRIRGSNKDRDSNSLVFSVVFTRQTRGSKYDDDVIFFIDNLDFFVNKDKQKILKKSTESLTYDF